MRETDADRSWQTSHGRTVNQKTIFLDKIIQGRSNVKQFPDWLQSFTVNLEDLETHVLVHSSEKTNSDSEAWRFKSGDAQKTEA